MTFYNEEQLKKMKEGQGVKNEEKSMPAYQQFNTMATTGMGYQMGHEINK